jgi:hypothetical protein
MTAAFQECNTEEQRSVVPFLWAKELNAEDIRKDIFTVYVGKCLLHNALHSWVEEFSQGR